MRQRVQRPQARRHEEPAPEQEQAEKADLAGELDDILDEVDAVLEENAQEFVNAFVQKGGE